MAGMCSQTIGGFAGGIGFGNYGRGIRTWEAATFSPKIYCGGVVGNEFSTLRWIGLCFDNNEIRWTRVSIV